MPGLGGILAAHKARRSHVGTKGPRRVLKFPIAKGKIIADVELSLSPDYSTIEIVLQDKTSLNFYLESYVRIFPELVSWKSGEYKPVRRWPAVNSKSSRR